MQRRWMFVIATALIGSGVLWMSLRNDHTEQASPAPKQLLVAGVHEAIASSARAPALPHAQPIEVSREEATDTASGSIRCERPANDGSAASRLEASRIDVNAHAAVGVWRPGEHLLRVLLLERAPTPEQSSRLLTELSSGATPLSGGSTQAVIELRFASTAQAFDRDEVESGSLTTTNAQGEHCVVDVLGSLQWTGSLPSPQAEGTPAVTQLELSAAGDGQALDHGTWQQSWHFSVSVPVALAQ